MNEETHEPTEREKLFERSKQVVKDSKFTLIHHTTIVALVVAVPFGLMANNGAEPGYRVWSFIIYGGAMFVAFRPYSVRENWGIDPLGTRLLQALGIALVALWFWKYLA